MAVYQINDRPEGLKPSQVYTPPFTLMMYACAGAVVMAPTWYTRESGSVGVVAGHVPAGCG